MNRGRALRPVSPDRKRSGQRRRGILGRPGPETCLSSHRRDVTSDRHSAALVTSAGSLSSPRFDSSGGVRLPARCRRPSMVDLPVVDARSSRRYVDRTLVLETTFTCEGSWCPSICSPSVPESRATSWETPRRMSWCAASSALVVRSGRGRAPGVRADPAALLQPSTPATPGHVVATRLGGATRSSVSIASITGLSASSFGATCAGVFRRCRARQCLSNRTPVHRYRSASVRIDRLSTRGVPANRGEHFHRGELQPRPPSPGRWGPVRPPELPKVGPDQEVGAR